jgi:hypothetical protein
MVLRRNGTGLKEIKERLKKKISTPSSISRKIILQIRRENRETSQVNKDVS